MTKQKGSSKGSSIDVKPLIHLLKFLPQRDVTLIILKGHLLIEEQLVSLLKGSLKYPAALRETRFSFVHRLYFIKAMHYSVKNRWLWRSIAGLNALRNQLAHKLKPAKLNSKIDHFLQSVEGCPGLNDKNESVESRLRHALIFLCGALQIIQKKNSPEIG